MRLMTEELPLEQRRKARSGMQKALGYRSTRWTPEKAVLELDVDERHLNINEVVHGGIYATLIDEAIGLALCWDGETRTNKPCVTLAMTTEFLGQPTTKRIIATAWRTGGGGTIMFAKAEVRDSAGELLATGGATYRSFKPRA